ncbi:hypothetical protein [Dactylosporangium sp. NPDC000521]|uniref:hypothetical protein n=1 Tax=Dactylosporangium sp. NPDC000521 TaxID=3363975 RepID=UPI0036B95437
MTITMTPDVAKILRNPFPPEVVGKLPRVWCKSCRDAPRGQTCDKHRKVKCNDCRNTITEAHLHLDYVGHAETTDRLLQADPGWSWEPVAFSAEGLPVIDAFGGLWIRLTVAGVTRLGYGHAEGKKGPDAIKEAIGDAIRNAAMRFGVALDLWGATFKEDDDAAAEPEQPKSESRETSAAAADKPKPPSAADLRDWALKPGRTADEIRGELRRLWAGHPTVAKRKLQNETGDQEELGTMLARLADAAPVDPPEPPAPDAVPMATHDQLTRMHILWGKLGYAGDPNRANRLKITANLVRREVGSSKELTASEATTVINALQDRASQQAVAA